MGGGVEGVFGIQNLFDLNEDQLNCGNWEDIYGHRLLGYTVIY